MKFIIEHLEEGLTEWVKLEYTHMIKHVGKGNLILANMSAETLASTPSNILNDAICTTQTALEYIGGESQIPKVLLLDPRATQELSPSDASGGAEYLLFGGILGDDPPRDRTGQLRAQGFVGRRLGPKQMTTDTAVIVSNKITRDGIKLEDLAFVDTPSLVLSRHESVEMPFRYLVGEDGLPVLSDGFLDLLRRTNSDSLA